MIFLPRVPVVIVFIAALGVLAGCPPKPTTRPSRTPAPESMPTYNTLAQRYNANLARLDRLWSRAVVSFESRDAKGKRRDEQGEGNLIAILPDRLALSVGKLGNTLLWAGCDGERYWVFELHEHKVAYVGRHATLGRPCSEALPIPLRPLELPKLMGLVFLRPVTSGGISGGEAQPPVLWREGMYLIEPPGERTRLHINPATSLPVRVELLDDAGQPVMVAELSEPESVRLVGAPPGAFPKIASRVVIHLTSGEGSMRLNLSDMSDGREGNKIKEDRVFDFDTLSKLLKPDETVVLDRACP